MSAVTRGPGEIAVSYCVLRPLFLLPRSLTPLVPPGGDGELPGHCHGRLPVLPLLRTASHHPEQHRAHPHLREAPLRLQQVGVPGGTLTVGAVTRAGE